VPLSAQSLPQIWQTVLAQTAPILAKELEKAGLPAIFGPNTLVLRFPASYNSHRERCQAPGNVEQVERTLRAITGHPCNVRIEAAGGEQPATAKDRPTEDTENSQSRYRRQRSEAVKEPLIRRAMEVLGAQLVDMDEGFGTAPAGSPERPEPSDAEEAGSHEPL
jgi:hypothetical protein